jgi:hypothetical protein
LPLIQCALTIYSLQNYDLAICDWMVKGTGSSFWFSYVVGMRRTRT